ncbi:MAG: LamG domain-containing protein [Anaerolineae bacterium]|nr:LamG domain-containing protein [Anaerolineae bacterium]
MANEVYKDDANLVALWSLDEASGTRYDYTGNDNDLDDYNTVGSDAGDKMEGDRSAVFVLLSSEYLQIADAAQTGLNLTPPFSIVFWVKFDSDGSTHGLCGKHTTGDYAYTIYHLSSSPYVIRVRLSSNGTGYTDFDADSGISSSNGWVHVAVVVNGTDVRIYYDGALVTASPGSWTAALNASSSAFRLGDRGVAGVYHNGHLDQFGILSRALSALEVASVATYGIQDPGGGVVVLRRRIEKT